MEVPRSLDNESTPWIDMPMSDSGDDTEDDNFAEIRGNEYSAEKEEKEVGEEVEEDEERSRPMRQTNRSAEDRRFSKEGERLKEALEKSEWRAPTKRPLLPLPRPVSDFYKFRTDYPGRTWADTNELPDELEHCVDGNDPERGLLLCDRWHPAGQYLHPHFRKACSGCGTGSYMLLIDIPIKFKNPTAKSYLIWTGWAEDSWRTPRKAKPGTARWDVAKGSLVYQHIKSAVGVKEAVRHASQVVTYREPTNAEKKTLAKLSNERKKGGYEWFTYGEQVDDSTTPHIWDDGGFPQVDGNDTEEDEFAEQGDVDENLAGTFVDPLQGWCSGGTRDPPR
ncbi:uncharacterized protein EI97DRAFT_455049 [Westerdykella ornata]|uniref:Uncharacterized protein n=1 Tax=Westerdykella ornata TaxID=318751 RepID=A0A6A6JV56_WESOR|nr:uncharacterized protein EI97DRAFT_455049 [Westerdykella ornata]KAF2280125.1 hypothetical protein EI97DRAFT_455049 [Westerdykella ornata]